MISAKFKVDVMMPDVEFDAELSLNERLCIEVSRRTEEGWCNVRHVWNHLLQGRDEGTNQIVDYSIYTDAVDCDGRIEKERHLRSQVRKDGSLTEPKLVDAFTRDLEAEKAGY